MLVHNGYCTIHGLAVDPENDNWCWGCYYEGEGNTHDCPECGQMFAKDDAPNMDLSEAFCYHTCRGGLWWHEYLIWSSSYRDHLDEGCPVPEYEVSIPTLSWEEQLVLEDWLLERGYEDLPDWVAEAILKR